MWSKEKLDPLDSVSALVKSFTGHTSTISSLQLSGNFLYSSSMDKTIKKWNILTGQLVSTFTFSFGVTTFIMDQSNIYAGFTDNSIARISIQSGAILTSYQGHTSPVNSIVVNGRYLFSGSYDILLPLLIMIIDLIKQLECGI